MTQDLQEEDLAYDYEKVEQKWQQRWTESKIFESDIEDREKYFINFPFPYINGAPHLGHGYSLMKAEAMARYQRMLGKNVLFPFAFHATGEPIVGMAKRIKAGDKNQIRALKISGVPDKDIENFTDPEYIINFFRASWTETVKQMGLAIDWRRQFVTTQLTPTFSKFVEWQYRKLKEEGYVVQGSHPVIWCPADQNPTGDHDRLEGEGARVVDFIVLKFYSEKFDAYFLPATLRPETIFGVTNMFVHPDANYVRVEVDGENVIVSADTVIKFKDQQFKVGGVEELDTKDLIGSKVKNPVNDMDIIVLPGDFIDAGGSTGVVMSVPAHAPMDWITLKNIQDDPSILEPWGVSKEEIASIKPISLITVDGYGEFPAGEEIDKLGITSRNDKNVKEATKTIYRREHNNGKLNEVTGKYKGKTIEGAKDQIIEDFSDQNIAFILKEPGEPVVCRCGTRNHVKYLENQWFLEFSNPEWKAKTHRLLREMDVFPREAEQAFHNTVDWLENKACARRSGLGTPMPWDHDWIIETLSDSVIYMAYYIVSKYVNDGTFKLEYATDEVYEYIMLGHGDPSSVAKSVGMDSDFLISIREELEYFYGFDLRTSGKDLLNNHLTFMLMHHTAIFPENFWPKGVAVNGYVGIIKPGDDRIHKESKSKGNFRTIQGVIEKYGVDATRLGFLIAGEGLKDAQFALAEAQSYAKWLQTLYQMAFDEVQDDEELQIDRWLISRVQTQIKNVHEYLSKMQTRSAFQSAYHEILQEIKWYIRRRGSRGPGYTYAIEAVVKMIAPFAPHVVEEIWEQWGREGFASEQSFPQYNAEFMDEDAEYGEKFLISFMDDMRGLKRFLTERGNPEPETIEIFIAPEWKYEVYMEAYENGLDNLIGRVMKNPDMRKLGKPVPKYCQELMKMGGAPDIPWSRDLEKQTIDGALEFISNDMEAKIVVINASDSNHPKADAATPRRPGLNFID